MPKKILVVEDDEPVLKAAKAKLENSGFEVIEAKNGEEGLEALSRKPDFVWLDIYMPKLDGLGFLERLKKSAEYAAYRDLPVIVVTASHGKIDDLRYDFGGEIKGYFVKSDVTLDKIVGKVREILGQEAK